MVVNGALDRSFARIAQVSYHSGARRVSVELQDGNRFEFCLPVPVRPGVRQKEEKIPSCGRTPRLSRLMGLAIHLDGLLSQGAVRSYRELAAAGHVSRARLSQILQLNHLAPEIQEQLLFLPPTRQGFDRLLEKHVLVSPGVRLAQAEATVPRRSGPTQPLSR